MRGERYIVKAMASAGFTTEGDAEYRIELLFPELPNTRMIRIRGEASEKITVEFLEVPNNKIIENLIEKASSSSSALGFFVDLLERRFGEGFIEKKIERTFSPVLIGGNVKFDGCEEIIAEENIRRSAETRAVKLLRSVVDRFFKEGEEDKLVSDEQPQTQRSFLGGIFGKIKTGLK